LLETIRTQEKDLKFANKVMNIMLNENEMYKIREKAQWDENRLDWKDPSLYFNSKDKDVQIPNNKRLM